MEILQLINNGSKILKDRRIYSHKLDSEILLSKVLKKTREELIISLEQKTNFFESRNASYSLDSNKKNDNVFSFDAEF